MITLDKFCQCKCCVGGRWILVASDFTIILDSSSLPCFSSIFSSQLLALMNLSTFGPSTRCRGKSLLYSPPQQLPFRVAGQWLFSDSIGDPSDLCSTNFSHTCAKSNPDPLYSISLTGVLHSWYNPNWHVICIFWFVHTGDALQHISSSEMASWKSV